jgi:surface-anchored protein
MRVPARLLLLPAALALAVATAAPAQATGGITLSQGHVDVFGVAYEDGELHLHVHAEDAGGEYQPHEVNLLVKREARTTVPDDPAYSFLGTPGSPVWVLPEVEDPDLLFAGLATEEIEPGTFAGDTVTVSVVAVLGPGGFSIFTTDPFGAPAKLADSQDGLPDHIQLPAGTHAHANWAFEAAGTYLLGVRASGVLAATGDRVTSDLAVYRFTVRR